MSTNRKFLKRRAAKVITRKEAASAGLIHYFSGKPCSKGHLAPRNVKNRVCIECVKYWNKNNPERRREALKKWKQNNRDKVIALVAKRSADKIERTPPWVTKDQLLLIQRVYEQAAWLTKITGIKWHVDHIVPLKGKNVSGLHVLNNLRVIPAKENMRKSNKLAALKRAARRK